ncbi:MAG: DUF362 domain-containing protein [Candidatus Aminicenantes bacterium]|nr:DUF362 domain-containing protein [Candidatus Aminicenantes bacterium]
MADKTKVIVIHAKGILSNSKPDPQRLQAIIIKGLTLLTSQEKDKEAVEKIFSPSDRVGIKINTIAGARLTTSPELALALTTVLNRGGIPERNMVIWDRTNRELKEAGYPLLTSRDKLKIFGTDTSGAGYESEPYSFRNIGSLFSTILTNFVTASISLAVLKDHGLAGLTAGMKNYFGAIHNPNKYHDNHCNPYLAELCASPPIKSKHRLTILDALLIQYHKGPSFHPRWATQYESLIFGLDPVATDTVGWQIIEKLRAEKGLPSLKEEGRPPLYLETATSLGLGESNLSRIQIIEEEV